MSEPVSAQTLEEMKAYYRGLRKSLELVPTRSRCAKHIVTNTDQERSTCLAPGK